MRALLSCVIIPFCPHKSSCVLTPSSIVSNNSLLIFLRSCATVCSIILPPVSLFLTQFIVHSRYYQHSRQQWEGFPKFYVKKNLNVSVTGLDGNDLGKLKAIVYIMSADAVKLRQQHSTSSTQCSMTAIMILALTKKFCGMLSWKISSQNISQVIEVVRPPLWAVYS